MISSAQKSLLHVAKQSLGMESNDYRALLERVAGVSSSKELDAAGFERVLAEFHRLGFVKRPADPEYGERNGMATAKQIALIRRLWQRYSGGADDHALCAWLERFGHISHLRFLTREQASNSIEGLKQMAARTQRAATSSSARAASA